MHHTLCCLAFFHLTFLHRCSNHFPLSRKTDFASSSILTVWHKPIHRTDKMAQQSLLALSNGSSSSNGPLSSHLSGSLNASARPNGGGTPKQSIERGASWSYNETRILLSLWGQDMVQRQLTNSKRTRHVWEKIAERIKEHGYERTPGKKNYFYCQFEGVFWFPCFYLFVIKTG